MSWCWRCWCWRSSPNGTLVAALVVTREPAPRPLTAERVATASKPAIAFIQSNYTIATSMPQQQLNRDAIERVLRPRVYSGELSTQSQIERAAYQLIFANPDAYFTPGPAVPDTWYHSSTGSGFFVTEDGYLVTAAHCGDRHQGGRAGRHRGRNQGRELDRRRSEQHPERLRRIRAERRRGCEAGRLRPALARQIHLRRTDRLQLRHRHRPAGGFQRQ